MNDPLITMEMILRATQFDGDINYCRRGARLWCETHGVDYKRLKTKGIPVSEVEHIDDIMGQRMVAIARGQNG